MLPAREAASGKTRGPRSAGCALPRALCSDFQRLPAWRPQTTHQQPTSREARMLRLVWGWTREQQPLTLSHAGSHSQGRNAAKLGGSGWDVNLGQPYRKVPILNERSQRRPQVPCTTIQDAKTNEHKPLRAWGGKGRSHRGGRAPCPLQAELSTRTRTITTHHPRRGEQMLLPRRSPAPAKLTGPFGSLGLCEILFKPESVKPRLLR